MKPKVKTFITMGMELESYSIFVPENRICRELHFPRRSIVEKGERFTRDWSIGTEYNSKVFTSIREASFLLKTGLRKYAKFRKNGNSSHEYVIFPVGGWIDRFAGSHIHLSLAKKGIDYNEAKQISNYLYDHIPFLIALSANSPVWRAKITKYASNRLLHGSNKYCKVARRGMLYKNHYRELTFNPKSKKKLATLELRVCDSSLPEYMVAVLCVCLAVTFRWMKKKKPFNQSTHQNYLKARDQAVRFGTKARLVWSNHWISVPQYVDLFFRKYKEELSQMDIPEDVINIFKYLKKGYNQADILREASSKYQRKHAPTWQRRFAKRYAVAIEELLDGNSYKQFALRLGVKLPTIERTWLGRKEANW
ncbi:MAG: glutamate-cysteine ligase family protein [Candidatus Omnitrophota bacterium]